LSAIQPANGGAPECRYRRNAVREAPVPRMRWWIEHIGQSGPKVAADQSAEDLQKEVLGYLLLGLSDGEASSGEGTDSSMGRSV